MNTVAVKGKNRYAKRARVSAHKIRRIIKLFAMDLEANKVAQLTNMSRKTVNKYFMIMRKRIAQECDKELQMSGIVELDESYFGPRRVRGKRGRGAGQKTVVFGIFKRKGKVYTEIVPDASKSTLQRVIRGRVDIDSVIHTDGWRGYNGLVDLGYKKHYRVEHGSSEFSNGKSHINGIEAFWSTVKTRLAKRRGIRREYLYLHLKECEFRYNHRNEDLYKVLLKLFKNYPLNYS